MAIEIHGGLQPGWLDRALSTTEHAFGPPTTYIEGPAPSSDLSGATDRTELQAAIDALPVGVRVTSGNTVVMVGGGGIIKLRPNRTYTLDAVGVFLKPNVKIDLNGSVIEEVGAGIPFRLRGDITGVTFPYNINGASVFNGYIRSTNGLGSAPFELVRLIETELANLHLSGFTGDALDQQECQWVITTGIIASDNGGWGRHDRKSADSGFRTNNCWSYGCKWERNDLGGWLVEEGHANVMVGGTSQFSPTGDGIRFTGSDSMGNVAQGVHLEGNRHHVAIIENASATVPRGSKIKDCFYVVGATTERFVVNEGAGTVLDGVTSNNSVATIPTTNGTKAPIQQHSTKGSITIRAFQEITGLTHAVCDEATPTAGRLIPMSVVSQGTLVVASTGSAFGENIVPAGSGLSWLETNGVPRQFVRLDSSNVFQVGDRTNNRNHELWGAKTVVKANALQHRTYATAGRPSASTMGEGAEVYDSTLDKPIYSDGSNWRDAMGSVV